MKFSIITINYNNRDGLEKTIKSVINQTYRDYEYIIIDGGSDDGSVEIIKEYSDCITYWVSERDSGIYNAMNKGVKKAKGEYLNFMNSGDCLYNERVLEEVVMISEEDIIMGNAITSNGNKFGPHMPVTLYNLCLHGFNHQALFFKQDLFKKHMYDENLKYLSDLKLVIQCLIIDNCSYHFENSYWARYDLSGISSIYPEERNEEKKKILEQLFSLRIAKDYDFFCQLRSPLLEDIRYLSKTHRLHKFVICIIRSLIIIHKKIVKKI